MDITPSPEFCAVCRIVLGGDTPDIVMPALLRTRLKRDIDRVHDDIVAGRRVVVFPLDPPSRGTQAPLPRMVLAVQRAAEEPPDDDNDGDLD